MLALVAANSHHALAQAQPSARERFARGWENGTPVTLTGQVSVFHTDDAEGRSSVIQSIRDDRTGQWFRLEFQRGFPGALRSGARVRVAGRTQGSELYVEACCDGTPSSNLQTISQPSITASGDQRTLVMIADLIDSAVSCATENIRDMLFAPPPSTLDDSGTGLSVNAEYLASSHGRTSWSGQVIRSALNVRSTDACDLAQYSATLDANAAAAGVDVASFPRKLYVLPPMSQCPFIGASTVGGTPSSSFSLSCATRGLYSHELGHAAGMSHAAAYYDAYTAGSGNFSNQLNEYGDYSDSMGASGWHFRGFNAPHREQMGWVPQGATRIVTASGRYDLAPLSIDPSTASAPQILKIPRSEGGFYYLSYRGGQAFDRYSPPYNTRVNVHRYGAPSEALSNFTVWYAALANGRTGEDTFTDQINGITVRMLSGYGSAPGSGAVVDVDVRPACVRTTPVLAVSPQHQSGSAGGSPSYSISITNNDAASCPAATFSLGGAVPSGWSGTLSADTLTLAPGVTGQIVLTVLSAATSQAGTYTTQVNASGVTSIVHNAAAAATYTVIDTTAPSQPLTLTAAAVNKFKQIKLSWGASSDNVAVTAYRVSRNGLAIATTTAQGWNDSEWKPGATYTYSVVAIDAAGNVSAPSNPAVITLSGGGGKGR
jgi:hypothetical protein